jgi:hypothetical protein
MQHHPTTHNEASMIIMTFAHRHAGTARPGKPATINGFPCSNWCQPPRGHVVITKDEEASFFRVSRSERRAFKTWAEQAFQRGLTTVRISGAWPCYGINR